MNYHDVKNQELKNTKDFSDKKLERYLKAHKVLLNLSSEFFFWSLSFIIFMLYPLLLDSTTGVYLFFLVSHLFYWRWLGLKWYNKEMTSFVDELELTIEVLKDIQTERIKN
jgi:hypothetical protein